VAQASFEKTGPVEGDRLGLICRSRRRTRVARTAALAVALGAAFAGGAVAAPQPWLPRAPYVGLHCPGPIYPCRNVGIAVWLSRPVRSVEARLDGHTVTLTTQPSRRGLFWQGFLDPHAQALADAVQSIPATIGITTRRGAMRTFRTIVYVSEGYG
jgi:hypothetical protein